MGKCSSTPIKKIYFKKTLQGENIIIMFVCYKVVQI